MQLDHSDNAWKAREILGDKIGGILGNEVVNGSSFHVLNEKRSQKNTEDPRRTIAILTAQISKMLRLLLDGCEPFAISATRFICRLRRCRLFFSRLDHFNKHIRDSSDVEHKMLETIIDQVQCTDCNRTFPSPRALVRHENSCHKPVFISRIDKVLGLGCRKLSAHDKTKTLIL